MICMFMYKIFRYPISCKNKTSNGIVNAPAILTITYNASAIVSDNSSNNS